MHAIDLEARMADRAVFPLPEIEAVERLMADLKRTSAAFEALVVRYGDPRQALRHFGLALWGGGDLAGAAQLFSAALRILPSDAPLWRDLAHVLQAAGRNDGAMACVLRALHADPRSAASWLLFGSLAQADAPLDAELAFRKAVDIQPDLADAHLALGLQLMGGQREIEAASSFRRVLELVPNRGDAALCLGQACYVAADYPGALAAFEHASGLGPMPDGARRNLNRARAFCAMLDGRVEQALDEGARAGEDPDALLYEAFSLFSAHGHIDAAIRIGRIRLSRKPDDPIRSYLLEVLSGHTHLMAPVAYLESYFDAFAPTFEDKLVNVLGYRVPERLAALAAPHVPERAIAVDLGCGTGLAARWLKPLSERLVGVDVASGMLEQAGVGGLYDQLIKSEAVSYLAGRPSSCDLVFAADMLVYLGPLEDLFEAAWTALRPDGLFCFSIEANPDGSHRLLSSGRFAHAPAYVRSLARSRFAVLEDEAHPIRLEVRLPVDGRLFVMRRSKE